VSTFAQPESDYGDVPTRTTAAFDEIWAITVLRLRPVRIRERGNTVPASMCQPFTWCDPGNSR